MVTMLCVVAMVKASHGARHRTRSKLRKKQRTKGMLSISRLLQKFEVGDKVLIKPEPSVQKGMPFKRFFGKHGCVVEKRGESYVVEVKDGRAKKRVICRPVHLRGVGAE